MASNSISNYSHIVVTTDFEPDDFWAFKILRNLKIVPRAIIVGEGDVSRKHACALKMIRMCGWEGKTEVVCGMGSNKLGFSVTVGGVQTDLDGTYFSDLEIEPKIYVDELFRQFMTSLPDTGTLLICLKPMREFAKWYTEDPAQFAQVCSRFDTLFYGSFNFRQLAGVTSMKHVESLLTCFRNTYIYESFYAIVTPDTTNANAGPQNSINSQNEPKLFEVMMSQKDEFSEVLCKVTELWNNCVKQKCVESCAGYMIDPNQLQRIFAELSTKVKYSFDFNKTVKLYVAENIALFKSVMIASDFDKSFDDFLRCFKVFYSVTGNESFQYVMADQCAIAAFVSDGLRSYATPHTIKFDTANNTQIVPCETSNIRMFRGISRNDMIAALLALESLIDDVGTTDVSATGVTSMEY